MTTTTTEKKLTITMSDRPPVTIVKDDWPRIASADWFSGTHEVQANELAFIRVRQHADGRVLVYGERERGPGGMPLKYRGTYAGYLLEPMNVGDKRLDMEEIIRHIRRVAGAINLRHLADECIASLPAEEI